MHAPALSIGRAPARAAAPALRVEVTRDPREAEAAWAALEAVAPASVYQTRGFALAWARTEGRATGVEPLIATVSDAAGRPLALLALGTRRRGPVVVASFLGGKQANFGLALVRPGADLPAPRDVLRAFAARTPGGVDLFALTAMPLDWEGAPNPFAALPRRPTPSAAYKTSLDADWETFARRRLSKDARKKLRQKEQKLAEVGPLRAHAARDAHEARAVLAAYLAQKRARFAQAGIEALDVPGHDAFLAQVTRPGAPIELHALWCGERIVATFGGGRHGDRFSGLFTSFDGAPDMARFSPGDILLSRVVEAQCRAGVTTFDLGVGEGRYKTTWCDTVEDLYDVHVAVGARGHAVVGLERARLAAKRLVKRTPWLWSVARAARKALARH